MNMTPMRKTLTLTHLLPSLETNGEIGTRANKR